MGINLLRKYIEDTTIKGVLMDLDNTLYAYEPAHQSALTFCIQQFKNEFSIEEKDFIHYYTEARKKVHQQLEGQGASHSRLLYFKALFDALLGRTAFDLILKFEKYYWDTFLNKMHLDLEAKEMLELLKEKDLPVCIVTDLTTEIQLRKIKVLKIESLIKYLVSSEEAGAEKPNKRIFNRGLELLQLKSHQVIMIGDHVDRDLRGAEKINIKTILYSAST